MKENKVKELDKAKQKKQKILYPYIGNKNTKGKSLYQYISPILRPTKLSSFIFFGLFLASILFSVTQISFDSFSLEGESVGFEVGYPYPMFVFDAESDGLFPFDIPNLIKDALIFLLISYVIDITVNLYSKIKITKKQKKGKPLEFKIKTRSIAQKATDKIVEAVSPQNQVSPNIKTSPQSQEGSDLQVPKPNN